MYKFRFKTKPSEFWPSRMHGGGPQGVDEAFYKGIAYALYLECIVDIHKETIEVIGSGPNVYQFAERVMLTTAYCTQVPAPSRKQIGKRIKEITS